MFFSFACFPAGDEIRHDFVMGEDMQPKRIRYLLPPVRSFYEQKQDMPIYKAFYKILQEGISAPSLDEVQRKKMEKVLHPLVFDYE